MPEKTIALVTGASAGIGAEFCRQLASSCDVIIATGRREDALQALAAELSDQVELHPVVADLAAREGRTRVIEALRQKGPVDYLVNNAGFGVIGGFDALELDAQQAMVSVHIDATMALCRAAIPFMRERGGGAIINVSSLGAFLPHSGAAVYGATKVFLNHFSEALQQELRDAGIRVQSLCPGYTRSEFHDRHEMESFSKEAVPEGMWMEASEVVAESLAALAGDQVIVVSGAANRQLAHQGLSGQLAGLEG
jgi:short-subunit dehydrogenase